MGILYFIMKNVIYFCILLLVWTGCATEEKAIKKGNVNGKVETITLKPDGKPKQIIKEVLFTSLDVIHLSSDLIFVDTVCEGTHSYEFAPTDEEYLVLAGVDLKIKGIFLGGPQIKNYNYDGHHLKINLKDVNTKENFRMRIHLEEPIKSLHAKGVLTVNGAEITSNFQKGNAKSLFFTHTNSLEKLTWDLQIRAHRNMEITCSGEFVLESSWAYRQQRMFKSDVPQSVGEISFEIKNKK